MTLTFKVAFSGIEICAIVIQECFNLLLLFFQTINTTVLMISRNIQTKLLTTVLYGSHNVTRWKPFILFQIDWFLNYKYLPSIGRNTDRVGLGILYLCIRLAGSLSTNTYHPVYQVLHCLYTCLLMVSIREPVSLIQRYSIPSPSLSVYLPIDGKY
jgi:hypothetical protein